LKEEEEEEEEKKTTLMCIFFYRTLCAFFNYIVQQRYVHTPKKQIFGHKIQLS